MALSISSEVDTPLYRRKGENLIKVNLETTGKQVKLTQQNGVENDNLQAELEALHTKVGEVQESVDSAVTDSGAIIGPASAVDGNLVAYDTTTGKLVKDSNIPMTDVSDAVTKKHEHANSTDVLDKLGQEDGKLTFDGQPVGDGDKREIVFADNIDTMPENLKEDGLLLLTTPAAP